MDLTDALMLVETSQKSLHKSEQYWHQKIIDVILA
jgi:hypothetical protein